jgi:hypothetical protein
MIIDDSREFFAALMKFYRHEHPEYDPGSTYALNEEFINRTNAELAPYNIEYKYNFETGDSGYYFATEDDRLFFRLKWGNGTELYDDV